MVIRYRKAMRDVNGWGDDTVTFETTPTNRGPVIKVEALETDSD
jgi:hypothetical protein